MSTVIPARDFSPSAVKLHTKPYTDGAGRYPSKLYDKLANEFATVLSYNPTEFSKIPVSIGRINPPQNRSSHIKIITPIKLSMNGTGSDTTVAPNATKQEIPKACGEA